MREFLVYSPFVDYLDIPERTLAQKDWLMEFDSSDLFEIICILSVELWGKEALNVGVR